ncbi:Z1 domain-containing protein [Virgibacillus necropolis]|uniref:Z1 domain-containing protein n=1 Tax=Virgibacillus necropolis TaxID=163877 RepID=UPI00384CA1A0
MSKFNDARSMALIFYKLYESQMDDNELALEEAIKKTLKEIPDVQADKLKANLLESINTFIGYDSIITDETHDHIPWYYDRKGNVDMNFWHRYERYLIQVKHRSPKVVQSIDETTDKILNLLEDPTATDRQYDRRGIVVGDVQSGKTANFTGLINKAVDMGYKLIIVLAGMHNSLRSQTQMRLDEEVLGYETSIVKQDPDDNKLIGVSTLSGEGFRRINSLTTRDDYGDFSRSIAKKIRVEPGVEPFLLVVKKNASVLKNVLNYFQKDSVQARKSSEDAPHKTVPNVPMLLIDDEADQASINTKDLFDEEGNILEDYDPTKINALIRQIYNTFEQKAYVGYTATPFANIFVHNTAFSEQYGSELFPKDFILSLPKPSNYIGPAEFFQLDEDCDDSMPLINFIKYHDTFVPSKHKKHHIPIALPESLKEAILTFLLSIAIRKLRGQENDHNSMLIHVTRFKDVQHHIYELIKEEMYNVKNLIRYGDTSSYKIKDKLKEIWMNKINPTSIKLNASTHKWEEIEDVLVPTVESIVVKEINGTSGDILDYKENESTGMNVITVGGDKLSRGLTLEGLTVSYYLRASKMYDTLMQMGRWFGYRNGYFDLCRIYTTEDLASWFRHIAVATEDLREEIEDMASRGATPEEFGLRVQTHPVMFITSQLKMKSGQRQKLSYRKTVSETTVFELDNEVFAHNLAVTDRFIRGLGSHVDNFLQKRQEKKITSKHYFWEDVPGEDIADFLSHYKTAPSAPRANSRYLKQYIEKQLENDELTKWTVCLINTGEKTNDYEKIGGLEVSKGIVRKGGIEQAGNKISLKRLLSAGHEFLDFTKEQLIRKEQIEGNSNQNKSQKVRGKVRNPKNGLLLIYPIDRDQSNRLKDKGITSWPIGIGLVFPDTNNPEVAVDYVVNNVFSDLEEQNG